MALGVALYTILENSLPLLIAILDRGSGWRSDNIRVGIMAVSQQVAVLVVPQPVR